MRTNILRRGVVLVLAAGLGGAAWENCPGQALVPESAGAQVIHLDDGTKLTLLGMSEGRHHVAPNFEAIGGNLRRGNWFYTQSNATVVWIEAEYPANRRPTYLLLVSDKANTGCVNIEKRGGSYVKKDVDVQGFVLSAFPRREKETVLRVKPYNGVASKEQFVITNAPMEAVAEWKPDALPMAKADGNLVVTLKKFESGAPMPYHEGESRPATNDPLKQCVRLNFEFREHGELTTNWQPWPVETFDATGNHVRGLIYIYPTNGMLLAADRERNFRPTPPDGYYYQPGLWPDEAAWKVRLEFLQRGGFSEEEIVTFTNLPVREGSAQDFDDEWTKTNFPFVAQGTVNGVQLKLLPPLMIVPRNQDGQEHLSVIIYEEPGPRRQEMNLTIVDATDDQGRELWHPFNPGWAGHFDLDFPRPGEVKTLNLKLALHRSRFVEFTVKPGQ